LMGYITENALKSALVLSDLLALDWAKRGSRHLQPRSALAQQHKLGRLKRADRPFQAAELPVIVNRCEKRYSICWFASSCNGSPTSRSSRLIGPLSFDTLRYMLILTPQNAPTSLRETPAYRDP